MDKYEEIPLYSGKCDKREAKDQWKPGKYFKLCFNCEKHFLGDKQARECAPCAYKDSEQKDPPKPRKPNQW